MPSLHRVFPPSPPPKRTVFHRLGFLLVPIRPWVRWGSRDQDEPVLWCGTRGQPRGGATDGRCAQITSLLDGQVHLGSPPVLGQVLLATWRSVLQRSTLLARGIPPPGEKPPTPGTGMWRGKRSVSAGRSLRRNARDLLRLLQQSSGDAAGENGIRPVAYGRVRVRRREGRAGATPAREESRFGHTHLRTQRHASRRHETNAGAPRPGHENSRKGLRSRLRR
mmetsp:Transcript_4986/g.31866  ORF Transcript_4986/g.31866 Transcript_4986/m.31866 type:complete len:222 (+) Transcript_4986:498-1163(+)